MPRARLLLALLPVAPVGCVAAAMLLGMACGSTGTGDTIQPITGVTVRAETLTAGRGCGTGSTQIFKYAVVVYAFGDYVAGNVYDCFTDGTFVMLPDIGLAPYTLEVFAYNRTAFTAAGPDAIATLIRRMNANRALLQADAGGPTERQAIASDLALLRNTNPTYSTTCEASQLGLVQTLAVCKPVQLGLGGLSTPPPKPSPASVILPLASFAGADGGVFTCDDQYVTVRTTIQVGAAPASAPVDTRCSALGDAGLTTISVTVANAEAPASYAFTATLLRSDGSTAGSTTCSADTSPGLTSTAVCKPLP
ncbi:hypothetical protein BH11MYX4_BH11MYX4_36470 [soil metagenome]